MNIKKIFILSLIFMFLLVPASFADEGDYKIPSVVKDITLKDDGSTVITEEIVYDIEGSVNGVYREIPLTGNQSIRNISVETPGYYNKLEINRNRTTRIKVWLYTDAAKTQKTKNAKVSVKYKYTITKGTKVYNDIVDFQYMTWGDWDTKVDHMKSTIHIPGSKDNTEYWNNPEDNVISSEWTNDNTLTTELENIYAHKKFEQRILMPTSYIKDTKYAQVINMDAKELIEEDERKYQEQQNQEKTVNNIVWTLLAIILLTPIGVYALLGREPKIDYDAEYEYDLPTDATPVQVNVLFNSDVGTPTNEGMYATILDLIDRKYFKIVLNDAKSTIIRQTDKDTSNLKTHEKTVINFLTSFAEDGDISIGFIGRRTHRPRYLSFIRDWMKNTTEETPDTYIKQYFDNKGSKIFRYLAILYVLLIVVILGTIFFGWMPHYLDAFAVVSMFCFMLGSIILYLIPNWLPGRWTVEGKEEHDKWKNFEKYLKDYSLIEERPPASVQVWGRYLVYASALGCANEVTNNMKKYFRSVEISDDSFYDSSAASFAYYNGFSHVEASFRDLSRSDSDSDSGSGIGSSGSGGFGGGGGGTF